jgi:hypothetical protein
MSSVTATVINNTSMTLTATAGSASHGNTPSILSPTLAPHSTTTNVFVAHSDGAGVEGNVNVAGGGVSFSLNYDNPVIGSNSGSVLAWGSYNGSCQAGGGTDATFVYVLNAN